MKQILPLIALLACSSDPIPSQQSPPVDLDSWTHITGVFVNPLDDFVYVAANDQRVITRDGTTSDFLPHTLLLKYALKKGLPVDEKANIEMKILRKLVGPDRIEYCVQFLPLNNEAAFFLREVRSSVNAQGTYNSCHNSF